MDYLLMSQKEYTRFKALQTIQRGVFKFLRKKRRNKLHFYSTTLIQKVWKGKFTKHTSFIKALQLDQGDHRIFFLKEQKMEFLAVIEEIQLVHRISMNAKESIKNDSEFLMIRYPNPLTFKKHDMPILQLSMPSY